MYGEVKGNGGLQNPRHNVRAVFFYDVRKETYRQGAGLYGSTEEDDGVQPPDERTTEEKLKDIIDFYYHTYMVLSKEDPLKLNEVLDLSLQESLSYLLYVVNKIKKQEEQLKNQKRIK